MEAEFVPHDAQSVFRMEEYITLIFDETKGCSVVISLDYQIIILLF